MCELDLLLMSRFRDEEDLRVAVDYFDMEVKTSGLMEKKSMIRSYGGEKSRTLKIALVSGRFFSGSSGQSSSDQT
jgi:hypothetical protein